MRDGKNIADMQIEDFADKITKECIEGRGI